MIKISQDNAINLILVISAIVNPIILLFSAELFLFALFIETILVATLLSGIGNKLFLGVFFLTQYSGVSFLSLKLYDIYITVFFITTLLFFNSKKIIRAVSKKTFIYFLLLFFIAFLSAFWTSFPDKFVHEIIRYILCIICVFLFLYHKINPQKILIILTGLAISNIILGLFVVKFFNIVAFESVLYKINSYPLDKEFRISGFFSDPNKYYLFFCIILLIGNYLYSKSSKKNKGQFVLLEILCLVGLILSFSRTAFIIVIGYLLLRWLKSSIDRIFAKEVYKILFYTFFLGVLLFSSIIINVFDDFLRDFTILIGREESLRYSASLSESNRVRAWRHAWEIIKENPFLGNGISSWEYEFFYPTHNTFVGLTLDIGLLGLLFFLAVTRKILGRLHHYYVLCLIILPFLTLDIQTYRLLYITIAILEIQNHESMYIRASSVQ